MGCLHGSVWITPDDIRPDYDDLVKAAAVDEYSFLFASRTVLGRGSSEMVESAWHVRRLIEQQNWFCRVCEENLKRLRRSNPTMDFLAELGRESLGAYLGLMQCDPLLPLVLYPQDYQGPNVFGLHKTAQAEIKKRAKDLTVS